VRVGIALYPAGSAREVVASAEEAERLGFDSVCVGDSHLIWRELYTVLGAIAMRTRRIDIGSGVTHPVVRHPSLTASAFATLAQLAPGRVRLGIGTGDSSAENMGVRRASLKELREAIQVIRDLLAGEVVTHDGHAMALVTNGDKAVPIYVAGASSAAFRLCGETADGALMAAPLDEVESSIRTVNEGASQAGRAAESIAKVIWTTGSISHDPHEARDAVRPVVARKALATLGRSLRMGTLNEEDREPLERLTREYDFRKHMGPQHNHLVLDRWIDRFALVGTASTVMERCLELKATGADELAIVFHGSDRFDQMRIFAKSILPAIRN
jgi:5,10-methylenetetrahydromethanopterin reductase